MVTRRQMVATAITCWLATVVAFALHLENPWWAGISAWIIGNTDRSALLKKGVLRLVGTILGCVIGLQLSGFLVGEAVGQILVLFLLGFAMNYMKSSSNFGYAWVVGSVAILLLVSASIMSTTPLIDVAFYRAAEISCGVLSVFVIDLFLSLGAGDKTASKSSGEGTQTVSQEDRILISLAAALSAIGIPILWLAFNLPELTQSLVTALMTLDQDFSHTRIRGSLRVLGCVVGGAPGLLFASLGANSFLWWSVALILGLALFAGLHLGKSPWAYVGTQGGIAYIMSLVTGSGPPDSLAPVANRLTGMIFGVLVTFGVLLALQLCRPSFAKILTRIVST
jgi:uncharacterized membrane protein YccC